MNKRNLIGMLFCAALLIPGCSKDRSASPKLTQSGQESFSSNAKGATILNKEAGAAQVSGVSYFDAADGCGAAGLGAAYAINMTGDLQGCLYTFVDEFECSPSGTYREIGREYFVGTYKGNVGTFWTNYKFEAKYEGCAVNGSYVGLEIKGRCQHPLVEGSGTGAFQGVTGRLDMKDDIPAGNYPYKGHLRF